MTLYEYIHEEDMFDDIQYAVESANKKVMLALYENKEDTRKNELKYIFENENLETLTEATEISFFQKIGKVINDLIEKIKEFLGKINNKMKELMGKDQVDTKQLQKVLTNNPEYAKEIMEAINNKKITLKDAVQFEKDVESLVKLYEDNKIDENSFEAKFKSLVDKYNDVGGKVLKTVTTTAGIVGIFATFRKVINEATVAIVHLQDRLSSLNNHYKSERADKGKVKAIISAFSKTLSEMLSDAREKTTTLSALQNKVNNLTKRVNDQSFDVNKQLKKTKASVGNQVGQLTRDNAKLKQQIDNQIQNVETKAMNAGELAAAAHRRINAQQNSNSTNP